MSLFEKMPDSETSVYSEGISLANFLVIESETLDIFKSQLYMPINLERNLNARSNSTSS